MISLHKLEPNTLLGFKALPGWDRSDTTLQAYHDEQCAALATQFPPLRSSELTNSSCRDVTASTPPRSSSSQAPVSDWSGLYVQLDVASAVHYLPNQWDRGASRAQIAAVYAAPGASVRVLCCRDHRLAESTLSSAEKATLVRDLICICMSGRESDADGDEAAAVERASLLRVLQGSHSSASANCSSVSSWPLIAALGRYGYALGLPDAEADAYELVLPHTLHNTAPVAGSGARVRTVPLFHFSVSTRLPGCTGAVEELPSLKARDVADPRTLATRLLSPVLAKMPPGTVDGSGTVQWWIDASAAS